MGASQRGIQRERDVVAYLRDRDWVAMRMPGSLGMFDVIALRAGNRSRLIEVKSTSAGPFHSFGPKARADLIAIAQLAGAEPWLAWWAPRKPLMWFGAEVWPS